MSAAMLDFGRRGPQRPLGHAQLDALVVRVVERYEEALTETTTPLDDMDTLRAARRHHAEELVVSSVRRLRDASGRLTATDGAASRAVTASGVPPRAVVEASTTLFNIALTEIIETIDAHPIDIATALFEHFILDAALTLDAAVSGGDHDTQAKEYIDVAALRAHVSKRQADVFQRLVENTPRSQIAAELGITHKTLKNHITELGNRLGARGRDGITQRARELSILIAVPTVMLANAVTDTITITNLF